ncbi:50S ribosomal protein L9 [Apibacter adventoris]|uniref:Large ribosomal subunit protein bL9 n=1 Tax=Apibacter adventoris TaxID=1679466 RepID=A0A2S8AAR8_9FLAO|nr:50S ribosomal protein L9 [Apibacter adventoris]PQL91557.1 50S ribosomal protein L9 [Apibacter adventoris]PQL93607.1 50S ribosomal protein L9 [Apibacter adventoris]
MEVILKQDVENLGLEFDVVNVKPGYARNYLIPKGCALLATPKNKAALEATLKEREAEEAALVKTANDIVAKLKEVVVTIPAKVGAGDKLFGSVNNSDLAEALAKSGVEIDKKYIKIPGNTIKRLGKYTAKVRLHRNVEYDYSFEVVSDGVTE